MTNITDMAVTGTKELLEELAALRKRVAEQESCESELIWTHSRLHEQITQEHRQTETALRLSEQKLSRIYTESPDAISISSLRNARYVEVNPAFERVFGYTREEALGRVGTELGIWPQPSERQRVADMLYEHGKLVNIVTRLCHKSGRSLDCLLSASLIEIDDEPCMMTIARDITERMRIEQLFMEQNRMLDALSQAQADFITDADPHLTFDQLLSHLLEITDSEYGFIAEVSHEDGLPRLRLFTIADVAWDESARSAYQSELKDDFVFRDANTLFGHVIATGQPVLSSDPANDPRGKLPEGHRRLASFMGLPLFRGAQLVGMLGVGDRAHGYDEALVHRLQAFTNTCAVLIEAYRNNLRRAQAESQLRRLNEELEDRVSKRTAEMRASLKELESFSYSVSHDLRSPLRGINGYSQVLLENYADLLDEDGKDHLRRIRAATLRMSDLIDSLLDLAQLTRAPMHLAEVDLSLQTQNIARELTKAAPERQVDFVIAPNVRASGDERLLRVTLENLITNAWKFTARTARPRIEFGVAQEGEQPVYFVRDNGAGFDMKYADRLFRPFERLHDIGEFTGTGIGLATVQRIIQRHGGSVWAEGETDKGATFHFTLPRVVAAETNSALRETPPESAKQ